MSWSKLESQLPEIAVFKVESVLVTEYKGDETIRARWKVDE